MSGTLALIAPTPVHCLSFAFSSYLYCHTTTFPVIVGKYYAGQFALYLVGYFENILLCSIQNVVFLFWNSLANELYNK